jgi:ATP-binding cassette, subfamily F, member 3
MIKLTHLALRRGIRVLFESVNVTVHQGNKVGITGANGCGKSSLFALMLNQLQSDEGDLEMPSDLAIAHVAQETPAETKSAIDYVLDGDNELRRIQQNLIQAEKDDDGVAQAHLHHQMDTIDAYSAMARAGKLMLGLGFQSSELEQPVSDFSGGWRMRLNLAQALMCRSDLLLLDEPTNHLDLDAVIWLEEWLLSYRGTLLLISHDRDFLDKVVGHVMHIEHQSIKIYTGNYSAFEKNRAEQLAQQQVMFEKQQRDIAHMEDFIRRFKAKASKAKQAQGRVKALERMELISQAHVDSPFYFKFFKPAKLPHPLMRLENVCAAYGETKILTKVDMTILPGDRIGLLGHNGAGKSTLIKLLAKQISPSEGQLEISSETNIGYFAQHQLEQLDAEASSLLHIQRLNPKATEQEIRNYLGGYNFHGDRVLEPIAPFSGGEKARLVLALLIYQKPNLLLLDEPTNHFDLEMRHALNMALQDFEGAMLIVSHDRHMLTAVTDQFWLVDKGKVHTFKGDLDAYRQWLLQPKDDVQIAEAGDGQAVSKKILRQQQAENRRKLQPLRNALKKVEQEIDQLTSQQKDIEQILSASEIYESENKLKLHQLISDQSKVSQQLGQLEERWMELTEQLEAAELSI